MLNIVREKLAKNSEQLRLKLEKTTGLNGVGYVELVKLAFDVVLNEDGEFDIDNLTEIDNGAYQGTLLYLIPFKTYQPTEYEYLMTSVGYGSCSGCDTLQSIQGGYNEEYLHTEQISEFMKLCTDILTNIIKPYNDGWREDPKYRVYEEEKNA